jgi:RNA polymerase sigma-70 factor (ECF subfamily)
MNTLNPLSIQEGDMQANLFLAEGNLIQAAQAGDLHAFNHLVMTYQDGLFRWVLSFVNDEDLAADLAQSTFITAYEKLSSFKGGSFRSWLFKIARNRSIDELRRQKRQPSISLDEDREAAGTGDDAELNLLSVIPGSDPLPQEILEQDQVAELIARLLESLPEGFRQVLHLVDMDGLDYSEVAKILNIPLGTVKSRVARARLKFRELALESGLAP